LSREPTAQEWQGFRPTAYRLDTKKVWQLDLIEGSGSERTMTFGAIFRELLPLSDEENHATQNPASDLQIERVGTVHLRVTSKRASLWFDGFKNKSFRIDLLRTLLELLKDGFNYPYCEWFWYDQDHVVDDPHESYAFFVVHGDAIVREAVAFSDTSGNGFDPSIFEVAEDDRPIWNNESSWHEAHVRHWYQRFFRDTRTGQLFALRPDEPIALTMAQSPEPTMSDPADRWGAYIDRVRQPLWIIAVLLVLILWRLW
jgi:hypothetical protein